MLCFSLYLVLCMILIINKTYVLITIVTFTALTLLVGCQEEQPVHKNLTEVLAWLSSGAKCKSLACGLADATASPSCLVQQNP